MELPILLSAVVIVVSLALRYLRATSNRGKVEPERAPPCTHKDAACIAVRERLEARREEMKRRGILHIHDPAREAWPRLTVDGA